LLIYADVTGAPPASGAMSFHAPVFLAALLLIPLAAALYVRGERRRARASRRIVAAPLLAAVLPRRTGARRHVPVLFHSLAATALILALARPHATVAVKAQQSAVMVLTDRSGSMQATDVSPNRLTAAKSAATTFLKAVSGGVRVGAIAFNQQPTLLSSPTRDYQSVERAIGTIKPAGSTATGDALAAALQSIKTARGTAGTRTPAAIVLLSDGKSVRGRDVLTVAKQAAAAKVPIYTVALGTQSGTITSAKSGRTTAVPPDTATLQQVAKATGGQAFAIQDAAELKRVYKKLGSQVATEREDREETSLFAGGALALAALGTMAGLRLTGRLV
jgi:Ca-activated chloride channel family protein